MHRKNTPKRRGARVTCAGGLVALLLAISPARAAVPDYKLGDVVAEDVVTPVQLFVVNPEATGALKQRVAEQVMFVVRSSPQTAMEVENELRQSIVATRTNFLKFFQLAMRGRDPTSRDFEGPAFELSVAEVARTAPRDLPLELFARIWVRGRSDELLVESMIAPLREVMAQPVVNSRADSTFPADQTLRLLAVKDPNGQPTPSELDAPGQTISGDKIVSLWRAHRQVETRFAADQEQLGRFAATFVRPNAYPDVTLTEILRARRMEGVTVNDTYEPAQVVLRKGQLVDRRALSVLAVMREKSLISALQTKLEQEHVVAGQITRQTKWIGAGLGVIGVALLLIFLRLRGRTSRSLVLADSSSTELEPILLPDGKAEPNWQQRALLAERKAERAHAAIRTGVMGWMREKIFQTMFRHRGELLSVQERAEAEMCELEQRLEQLHVPLQERIASYQKRIEDLEKDLAVKGEENRQLITARITVAREHLEAAPQRGGFSSN